MILIDVFGSAIGRAGGQEIGHAVARRPATGPVAAIGRGAILRQFGRIQTEQADAIGAEPEAVAVADAAEPGNGRRRPIERSRDQRQNAENDDGQNGPAGAAEDGIAVVLSTQDFTAR